MTRHSKLWEGINKLLLDIVLVCILKQYAVWGPYWCRRGSKIWFLKSYTYHATNQYDRNHVSAKTFAFWWLIDMTFLALYVICGQVFHLKKPKVTNSDWLILVLLYQCETKRYLKVIRLINLLLSYGFFLLLLLSFWQFATPSTIMIGFWPNLVSSMYRGMMATKVSHG